MTKTLVISQTHKDTQCVGQNTLRIRHTHKDTLVIRQNPLRIQQTQKGTLCIQPKSIEYIKNTQTREGYDTHTRDMTRHTKDTTKTIDIRQTHKATLGYDKTKYVYDKPPKR